MLRSRLVFQTVMAMSFVGFCNAGIVNAAPSADGGDGTCSFVLTPPKIVQVSTATMVMASVKPGPCTMDAIPNGSTVCMSLQGQDSRGECNDRVGPEPAMVYYPYRPGGTYIVTGRGCADSFYDPVYQNIGPVKTICQTIGPTSFTM